MSFISKVNLKYQLKQMGIRVEGNYVRKSDLKKVIATTNRYWHGSPKDHGTILKVLPHGMDEDELGVYDFGGVFLATDKTGHIHGDRPNFWYFIDLKDSEILSLNDLYHRYKDPRVKEVLERLLPDMDIEDDDWLTDKDIDSIEEFIEKNRKRSLREIAEEFNVSTKTIQRIENRKQLKRERERYGDTRSNAEFIWDEICERGRRSSTRINHLLGSEGEWELQMIQGQIAEALGFKAVEMTDERGASYLLVGPNEMQKEDDDEQELD